MANNTKKDVARSAKDIGIRIDRLAADTKADALLTRAQAYVSPWRTSKPSL